MTRDAAEHTETQRSSEQGRQAEEGGMGQEGCAVPLGDSLVHADHAAATKPESRTHGAKPRAAGETSHLHLGCS